MTGEEVRAAFEQMLPQDELNRLCQQCGVIERQHKLNLAMLVRAMVIAAGTPGGAYQADVLRAYLESEVPRVTRAAFYRWFDEPLERFMEALAQRALAYAQAQPVDLLGPLSGVKDWYIVDSTTIKVRDALLDEFPGTGGYAALKVHKILSVGCGAPVRYHFSPARDHDSPHLQLDESWRGYGLLADLAYASLARLRACETYGVLFVIRLKDNWKPKVDYIARGQVTRNFSGTDLDALLDNDTLVLDGRAIDADVHVGGTTHPLPLRLIGVQSPKGYGFFLTNFPPRLGPLQVADLLAHTHNLQSRPTQQGALRTAAPLHTRLLALQLAVSCQSIAQAFDLRGTAAKRRWEKIAELLTHAGTDPNWRRRPSILDQLRGWKRQPGARAKNRHRHAQMAA